MTTWADKQKQEIETIQERNIPLNLSTADVVRLATKAASAGLTISQLLENYIGDLVDGTYSNGSDEREYANRYFERCGFEYTASKTFLRYNCNLDTTDYVVDLWDTYQCAKENMEDDDPDITSQEREYAKCDMEQSLNELKEYYAEYQTWAGSEAVPFEAGMEELLKWDREVKLLKQMPHREATGKTESLALNALNSTEECLSDEEPEI